MSMNSYMHIVFDERSRDSSRSITAIGQNCHFPTTVNEQVHTDRFLANANSRSRSLYAFARLSVCLSVGLSSVTLVRRTQPV